MASSTFLTYLRFLGPRAQGIHRDTGNIRKRHPVTRSNEVTRSVCAEQAFTAWAWQFLMFADQETPGLKRDTPAMPPWKLGEITAHSECGICQCVDTIRMPSSQVLWTQDRYPVFLKTKIEQMHTCHQNKVHKLTHVNAFRHTTCPMCGTIYDCPTHAMWHQCNMESMMSNSTVESPIPIQSSNRRTIEYREGITATQMEKMSPLLEQCQYHTVKDWLEHQDNTMLLHPNTTAMILSAAMLTNPFRFVTVGNLCVTRLGPASLREERTYQYLLTLGILLGAKLYQKWLNTCPYPEDRFPPEILQQVAENTKHTRGRTQTILYDYMKPKRHKPPE